MQIPAYVEKEEADKRIRAATLHHCELPIKPMTLEEVLTVSLYEGNIVWLEYRDDRAERCGYNGFYEPQLIAAHTVLGDYKDEVTFYPTGAGIERTPDPAVYNIGWRCWSRKPTEQERKAYEWEGSRIEYPRLYSTVGSADERIELKSCPFCGEKALFTKFYDYLGVVDIGIGCTNCSCVFSVDWLKPEEHDLAAAWNRRAEKC
jgi:hypothetical protein